MLDKPFFDPRGRATFFAVKIANVILPIFQPGTLMLDSAVVPVSPLAISVRGQQQNKLALSYNSAIFLTKVVSKLASTYQRRCAMVRKDVNSFYPQIYEEALEEVLEMYHDEDRK